MDLNPYKFEASWTAWEFAYHVLYREANLIILSMAWLTREDARSFSRTPKEPDMETLSYWLSRLEPIIRSEGEDEIICVFANRTGSEEEAVYAGTSAVLGIQEGEVKVYGILGRGENKLLIVDTSDRPKYSLICDPKRTKTAFESKPSEAGSPVPSPRSSINSGSKQSFDSGISISTSKTSADPITTEFPPIDNLCFTPTSPADDPFIQPYFGDTLTVDVPTIESKPEVEYSRRPTPVPVPLSPRFYRPSSPKSRNCSRSRGPAMDDSPLSGSILTEEVKPTTEVRKTLEEARKTLANFRASRAEEWASDIDFDFQDVSDVEETKSDIKEAGESHTDVRDTFPGVSESSEIRESRLEMKASPVDFEFHTPPKKSVSAGPISHLPPPDSHAFPLETICPSQFESSFTRNSLGPRSRHISPRPRSTVW